MQIQTDTEEQTRNLGERLSAVLNGGEVIALIGELGSGKTMFVHGLATGLGIQESVHSPSFTILNEYHDGLILYHFDFYRLKSEEEVWNLGWQDYLNSSGIMVIEWADRFPKVLPQERLEIRFTPDSNNPNIRILTFTPIGAKYTVLLQELQRAKGNVKFQNPNAK
jgi:tRNA threonylcarbamoyladenosine biosynthesis protein TsaE